MNHPHQTGTAARRPTSDIDDQILGMWCALRANPSLDARWAMQVIDRLLDERSCPAQVRPPVMPAVMPAGPAAGPPSQAANLASILRALSTEEPG